MNRNSSMLAAVLAVLVFALVFNFSSQSIFAPATLVKWDTGSSSYIASYTLRNNDVTYLPISASSSLLANGQTVTPNAQGVTLKFVPSVPTCTIPLTADNSIPQITYKSFDGSTRTIPGITLYRGGTVSASFKFTASATYKGVTTSKDMDAVLPAKAFFKDSDGNGYIEVEGNGFLGGAQACASSANVAIAKLTSGGATVTGYDTTTNKIQTIRSSCGANLEFVPKPGDIVTFGQGQRCQVALDGLGGQSFLTSVSGFDRASYLTISPSLSSASYSLDNGGTGLITVRADAAYFDSQWIYSTPKQAKFSFSISPATFDAKSGQTKPFTVTYKNIDTFDGTFYGKASAGAGSVSPSSFDGNVVLKAGESRTQTLNYFAPTTLTPSAAIFTVEICSRGGAGVADACSSQSAIGIVNPGNPSPTPTQPPGGCNEGFHKDSNGNCVPNEAGFDLNSLRLSKLFCSSPNGILATVCTKFLPAATAVVVAIIVTWSAFGFLFLPAAAILAVLFYFVVDFIDLYWLPLLLISGLYRYGKKRKWF